MKKILISTIVLVLMVPGVYTPRHSRGHKLFLSISDSRRAIEHNDKKFWKKEAKLTFGECHRLSPIRVWCEATVTGKFFIVNEHPIISSIPENQEAFLYHNHIITNYYESAN